MLIHLMKLKGDIMELIGATKVKFSNVSELMEFLYSTNEFLEWEVCKLDFSTSMGSTLNIDLSSGNTVLNRSFIEFEKIKDRVYDFYLKNKHLSLTIDIKFKVPYYLKKSIDNNSECDEFYLDFYSKGNLNIMTPTFTELNKDFNNEIGISWIVYALNIVQQWYNKKLING